MTVQMVLLPPPTDTLRGWAARLVEDVPGLEVVVAADRDDAARLLSQAQAAYGTLDPALLAQADRLEWLQAPSAAPQASYYFPELVDHPVRVTDFRGIISDHVAAHALALVLALGRGLHRYAISQHAGEWIRDTDPTGVLDLPTAVAAVIGVGAIGSEVSRMLAAFGADVIGVDLRRRNPPVGMRALYPIGELDTVLAQARLVVITVPQTPATVGLFDARRIGLIPPGGYLVNVGRGATVDLDAVLAALDSRRLAGVGLDVVEPEPLPPGHPLWSHPSALLTPHVAGIGPHLDPRKYDVLVTNANRFVCGEPLLNQVDKACWY